MKATELRIGNWTEYNIVDENIDKWILEEVDHTDIADPIWLRPIPLTEEWLLKFGFHKQIGFIKFIGEKYTNSFEVSHNDLDKWYCFYRNFNKGKEDDFVLLRNDLKHVHQLQNLYFALTGKELSI